ERGEKRLVAYVVAGERRPVPTTSEWRHHLQRKLPDYMIPSVFVLLEAMPLTPNGKVDRKALPAPGEQRPRLAAAFVAPRTAAEEALAEIWREVLGVERVGVDDNFFDLGGHSLLATQLVSRVEKTFQVKLSLRRLFETPNIAELAQLVTENAGQQKAAYSPPKITPRRNAGQSLDELLTSLNHLPEHEAKRILEERSSR
ncbi:MAG TPA: phosphopantetheine-binding protein, partial [Pyrinomonadaceae bacterium]|nr:phosphopantetheine-binding protein [Pyrinomonadaceae bacterium]